MKKKVKRVKKKNPQDATLRNIRALKARVKKLEDKTISLEAYVKHLLKNVHC